MGFGFNPNQLTPWCQARLSKNDKDCSFLKTIVIASAQSRFKADPSTNLELPRSPFLPTLDRPSRSACQNSFVTKSEQAKHYVIWVTDKSARVVSYPRIQS